MSTYAYELLDRHPALYAGEIRSDPNAVYRLGFEVAAAMLLWAQHEQDRVVYASCWGALYLNRPDGWPVPLPDPRHRHLRVVR